MICMIPDDSIVTNFVVLLAFGWLLAAAAVCYWLDGWVKDFKRQSNEWMG